MRDLIERLRDADPLPDAERLTPEDQRAADALLDRLTSEPVPAASPPRRPRLRGLALAAGVAAALALALAVVSLIDDEPGGPGVVELAVAASTDKAAIYHKVALERLISADVPAGALGREAIFESWDAPDGSTHQKVFRAEDGRRGKLVGETAGRLHPRPHGRFGGPVKIYDPRTQTIRHSRFGRIGKWHDRRAQPRRRPRHDPAVAGGAGSPAPRGDRACRRTGRLPARVWLGAQLRQGPDRAVRVPRRQGDLLPAARPLSRPRRRAASRSSSASATSSTSASRSTTAHRQLLKLDRAPRARSSTTATGSALSP